MDKTESWENLFQVEDLVLQIFTFLDIFDLLKLKLVGKQLKKYIASNLAWKVVILSHFGKNLSIAESNEKKYKKICCDDIINCNADDIGGAWDPSCGGHWKRVTLEDIGYCYSLQIAVCWLSVNAYFAKNVPKGKFFNYWKLRTYSNYIPQTFKMQLWYSDSETKKKNWILKSSDEYEIKNTEKEFGSLNYVWLKNLSCLSIDDEKKTSKVCSSILNKGANVWAKSFDIGESVIIRENTVKIWERMHLGKVLEKKENFWVFGLKEMNRIGKSNFKKHIK